MSCKCQEYIDYRKECDEDIERRNKERIQTMLLFTKRSAKKEKTRRYQ